MASNLVPDFEVKVLLKPSEVLGSNNKFKDEVVSAFDISSDTKKMSIQFVDTKDQDAYTEGWSLRIRKTEGRRKFELTYKKRYSISDGSSTSTGGNIDAALETAKKEGFDSTTSFEAQVEVGYPKQTLSISQDEKVPDTGFQGIDLPPADNSRKLLCDNAPNIFRNWKANNWGTDLLVTSIVYGPVFAQRYEGTLNKGASDELVVFIEVWPIRKSKTDGTFEPIVEASFKTKKLEKAQEGRAKLVKLLQDKGWFLAANSLKTKLIMERYGEVISGL
ncbi:hypothetical protein H2198_000830 [Neophaeococcomyces mojaviensis]|uniref:Uncharacterized protein n=1 Tax=Neophaeococcomyces mojaviensis TaxID=3383035 RepID=A0ACC3AIK3_9EURO|nr:hypothetical protein H2198_000830 [Knufia sp. JES_112]